MKLVEEENIHLTLKFLGEVEKGKMAGLKEELGFLGEEKEFEACIKGVGAFPSPSRARVLWVGVGEGADRVCEIQKQVDDKLAALGFEKDKRFHPHYTLARFKEPDKRIKAYVEENKNRDFGSYGVDAIRLMESKLSSKGPTYSLLEEFKLLKV